MESNQRFLPPKTSPVNIEVSLNHRRKDLPADSIAAVQVKHDATVSMKIPLLKPPRYRSEAFLVLSSSPSNAKENKFRNSVEHVPTGSKNVSWGSKFARGALKANGEECNQCVSDHSKKQNGGIDSKRHQPDDRKSKKTSLNGGGSEEKSLRKQRALDIDTTRHCSPLRRQRRVQFELDSLSSNGQSTLENCSTESLVDSKPCSLETEKAMEGSRGGNSSHKLSPISELKKFIEEEKEQQNIPNDAASKEQGELLETSTDSLESGSEINPLWVLDSITASVEKCNSPAYETIFEEEVESEIVLDSHSDGKAENSSSEEEGIENISGASAGVRTVLQNPEEKKGNKRLSQGSDGSFGFEPQYEEDFSGYVEGKEYFKNLPTFHRLLTSAEKEELDDEQIQKNELITLRLEEQIPGIHEQSDYAQDMMDTHAMRSEYWDYPYPSQNEAFDKALRSEDKSQLLENMRMKIRGRLRQPGNSSSDSGCQDTDANHSSLDESDAIHRIHSNKGQCQEQAKSQIQEEQTHYTSDSGKDREDVTIRTTLKTESSSLDQSTSNRRQILEGLKKLIASSDETKYSLSMRHDSNHHPDTQNNSIGLVSGTNEPSIPARPMAHGQLKFVHYENITIVKKCVDEGNSEVHPNTPNDKQGANENCRTINDKKVGNQESIVEPIDIDLSDPDVLEATKRMQLAFRKRRELHGSRKFRSMQRMRAESDSISYRSLGLCTSVSLENHAPFQGDIHIENRGVQMMRHNSLPLDFAHSQARGNITVDNSPPDSIKTREKAKERVCKKLSRQKSVSQYQPFAASLIEQQEPSLAESRLTIQSVEENDREEPCENGNPGMVLSEEVPNNTCAPLGSSSASNVCEVVNPSMELPQETSEGEDLDKKLKCLTGNDQQPTNTSEKNPQEPGPDALQDPDIDLKDPKVQDASKMIQQVFRRKKLHSKRSKGSVEEKACKKVQANKANSLNHSGSSEDTPVTKDTQRVSESDRTDFPQILCADTTVNVVISDDELDKNTLSTEQQLKDQTINISTTSSIEPIDVALGNTPATLGYQTYKGVVIVNEKLSEQSESDSKPPSMDRENTIHADDNANFRSPLENKHVTMKRASSIKEANLGDEIDIDLLDAEVKEVTEKLNSVPSPTRFPTNEELRDIVLIHETDLELRELDNKNSPQSKDANSPVNITDKSLGTNKTNKRSDVDIDLSDPDVQKTAFKLQSAFWKKKTSKHKTQTTSTKKDVRGKSVETNNFPCQNITGSATSKKENGSLIGNESGKVESASVGLNQNELDNKVHNKTEIQEAPTPSRKCEELEKTFQSTNNGMTKARPEIFNSNTGNLVSTSSKQTTEIDIDLNDTKVKEVTRKIQNIFKRKRTPSKTGETPSKVESKKSLTRLKSAAATSLGSKLQTMPMISTSFLDRGEKGRKETKALIVSADYHGNTDGDERMVQSSNRYGGGELAKVNDEVANDNTIGEPQGTFCDKTESQRIPRNGSLPSIQDDSSKTDSISAELTTPSIPCDDGGVITANDTINAACASPVQSTLVEGAKGDKFTLNHGGRKPASVHYVDVDQPPVLPSSSTASLKMQDEVDIERLMTTSIAKIERNGHVKRSNSPVLHSPTSLTTVPLSQRTPDREGDVDNSRLQSTSTTYVNGKHVHGYLEQVSDDTEYETAYSDFSDRVDELERTLVQEETIQMETAIQHHSPRFLIRPKNASCFHGDHARFVCCMTGSPHPDISWFASGKVIRPERNNRLKITDYSEDNNDANDACALVSILDIVEVKFEDKGEYACVAINSQGQAFSSAQLDVEKRDSGAVQQSKSDDIAGLCNQPKMETSDRDDESNLMKQVYIPSASLPRQKVQALVGSKASFFCPVEGEPLPEVKWLKDDNHITGNHGDDRVTLRVEGSIHCLDIRDIMPSDAGLYVCSAANEKGMVLCVSLLEVQESTGWAEDIQQVKQRTPMLIITEPEIFRQLTRESESVVPSNISKEGTVVRNNDSNQSNIETFDQICRKKSDEEGLDSTVRDISIEDTTHNLQRKSGEITNRNNDDILNSVLSTYGPRESQRNNYEDRLSVTSNEGVARRSSETNSSEAYVSAEGPRGDDDDQVDKKAQFGTPEGDNVTEPKHHKGSKRRSSRRNHLKSPTKISHSLPPADKVITEFIDLDEVNGFARSKSSRKKRSSSRRKKSPIHSKNVERVRLDLEKAEELTEKVDSCLDIIDDLLTLTSYDENENETEEKLRQKLDTLVHKFGDSESDAGSLSSRRGTPSHRRKERLSKVDLLHLSDSNGEYMDGSDVNINVSRIQSDGNIWGQCSLEDSLKVMSELVGNIAVTVRDPGLENESTIQAHQMEHVANGQEKNINNNNNSLRKALAGTSTFTGQKVKRTPLRDLLKQSLFSQELTRKRVPRRPLPVTRSLDSVDDIAHIHNYDGRRRHSFGSLYAPRYSRPSRNPLLRTLSIRRRNRDHSTESSSSDDEIHGRFQGRTVLRRPRQMDNGQAFADCPSQAGSTDSLQVHQEDKFQQFPDGDRLSSPIDFEDSDSSFEEHDHHYPHSTKRLQNLLSDTESFPEHTADQRATHTLNATINEQTCVQQHKNHPEDKIENGTDQSKSCVDEDNSDDLQDHGVISENSLRIVHDETGPDYGGNSIHDHISFTKEMRRTVGGGDPHDDTVNGSKNDSGFSSSMSPSRDRQYFF